jgi:hypothetical protein
MWDPRRVTTLWASTSLTGVALSLLPGEFDSDNYWEESDVDRGQIRLNLKVPLLY